MSDSAVADTLMVTRKGCERISRFAFTLAREKRRGAPEDGQKRVTLIEEKQCPAKLRLLPGDFP